MTDSAMEEYMRMVDETMPPWFRHPDASGTFMWDLPKQVIWRMFKLIEEILIELDGHKESQ